MAVVAGDIEAVVEVARDMEAVVEAAGREMAEVARVGVMSGSTCTT